MTLHIATTIMIMIMVGIRPSKVRKPCPRYYSITDGGITLSHSYLIFDASILWKNGSGTG